MKPWQIPVLGAALVGAALCSQAEPLIDVRGAGWLQSQRIERAVRSLSQVERRETLDANAVEDAVFFTLSDLAAEGYLRAEVRAEMQRATGERLTHNFDRDFNNLLARPLTVTALTLQVHPGVRFHFGKVEVQGGDVVLTADEASQLIVPRAGLLRLRSDRVYTPQRLQSALDRIEYRFKSRGFAHAVARLEQETRDDTTGAVDIVVVIEPGARWWVNAVEVEPAPVGVAVPALPSAPHGWWTAGWQQDVVETVRQAYYAAGYTEVRLAATTEDRERVEGGREVVVRIAAQPGSQVIAGEAQFTGDLVVAPSVLHRRVEVVAGKPLNLADVESTRRRLGRLRAFSGVGLSYVEGSAGERVPVFDLEAREPWESSLLLGYGSYEQVRGGFEVRGFNLLGRSHQLRLEAVGSLKSVRGDLVYTVPDLFGETVDAKVRLFGLDRDELSFQRQEYGATLSLTRRAVPWIDADLTTAYTFQDLRSRESDLATRATDVVQATSASLSLGLTHDGRDNPLLPRKGVRWFAQVEGADPSLGGEVGFQRFEAGWSWHRALGSTNWIHVGLIQGTVLTLGQDNDSELPANKRFYPGGEHSLRGMTSGEAVPRNEAGEFIGAKSFTLLNLEFEQALTRRVSAVLFYDALGETAEFDNGLWDVKLHTVGVGIRYQTLIGPLRLEYGHNLNPRPLDPDGTLHFSIGFPF